MEAAPGAEVLPFESVILSTQQEIDPWLESPVGEVASADRVTTLARAPAGTGRGHVCGTEEEFREGGTLEADLPPVDYGALGLPLCCEPPKRVRGGAGAGGRAALVVEPLIPPPVSLGPFDACQFPLIQLSGPPWSVAVSPTNQNFSWLMLGGFTVGVTYRITIWCSAGTFVELRNGTECPGNFPVVPFGPGPREATWTQQVSERVWVDGAWTFQPGWSFWIRPV